MGHSEDSGYTETDVQTATRASDRSVEEKQGRRDGGMQTQRNSESMTAAYTCCCMSDLQHVYPRERSRQAE